MSLKLDAFRSFTACAIHVKAANDGSKVGRYPIISAAAAAWIELSPFERKLALPYDILIVLFLLCLLLFSSLFFFFLYYENVVRSILSLSEYLATDPRWLETLITKGKMAWLWKATREIFSFSFGSSIKMPLTPSDKPAAIKKRLIFVLFSYPRLTRCLLCCIYYPFTIFIREKNGWLLIGLQIS